MATNENLLLRDYVYSVDRLEMLDRRRSVGEISEADYYFFKLLLMQTSSADADFEAAQNEKEYTTNSSVTGDQRIKNLLFRQSLTSSLTEGTLREVARRAGANLQHKPPALTTEEIVRSENYDSKCQVDTKKELQAALLKGSTGILGLKDLFTPNAANFLSQQKLTPKQIDQFLDLVADEAPDMPYLTTLVTTHLKKNKFGSKKIHRKLTRDQLFDLYDKNDKLASDEVFMGLLCAKLRDVDDSRLDVDQEALGRCLARQKEFVVKEIGNDCAPLVNLKGLVLYHYLSYQETVDDPDVDAFREYLKVPKKKKRRYEKPAEISVKTGRKIKRPAYGIRYNYTNKDLAYLPAIGSDNEYAMVDRYCHFMFLNGQKPKDWKGLMDDKYMVPIFSEEMLCAGKGNEKFQKSQMEMIQKHWGRKAWKRINTKVVLCLCRGNPKVYTAASNVQLKVELKNVSQLTVRVYQINARSYYVAKEAEVPMNVSVHGANPVSEWTIDYLDPPAMKKIRSINIPDLAQRRGTFVVELSGSGQKTRALVRKGEYRYLMEQTSDGQVFKIVNETGAPVEQGRIYMDGVDFLADDKGEITIPFGTANEPKKIVMDDMNAPGTGSLGVFDRLKPEWLFNCGVYIDREQLVEKREAKIVVRPNLYMCNELLDVEGLTEQNLLLITTNAQGKEESQVIALEGSMKLADNKETVVPFIVPVEVRKVVVKISAKYGDMELSDLDQFEVNGIDSTPYIADIYLTPQGQNGYCLSVWGKNAEPYQGVVVDIKCTHRYFADPLEYTLQTDINGRVWLGRLPDITKLQISTREDRVFPNQTFNLLMDRVNVPIRVNGLEGTVVSIPCPSAADDGPEIKLYDEDFRECFTDMCTYDSGYIRVDGLPTGDFKMFIRDEQNYELTIHISAGQEINNRFGLYVISPYAKRILQLSELAPLHISAVKGKRSSGYDVTLDGANDKTRVHIIATHFCPRFDVYDYLKAPNLDPDIIDFESPLSENSGQAEIEAEYRYVFDRKSRNTIKNVGNLLAFPSLSVNGWQTEDDLLPREPDRSCPPNPPAKTQKSRFSRSRGMDAASEEVTIDKSNLDFLYESGRMYTNVALNMDDVESTGTATFRIDTDQYTNNHNMLKVIAVDDDNISVRNIILEEPTSNNGYRDVTVGNANSGTLPYAKENRYVQIQKIYGCESGKITGYSGGEKAIDNGIGSSYNSITQMVDLFRSVALSKNKVLREQIDNFTFLGEWDSMANDDKLSYYDQFQCNELNYFIFKQDREFFDAVVVDILKDKALIHGRFFDHALLMIAGVELAEQDRHPYLQPDASFPELNTFERFLRAQALGDPTIIRSFQRYIKDSSAGLRPDQRPDSWAEERHLFHIGLTGRSQTRQVADGDIAKMNNGQGWPGGYAGTPWRASDGAQRPSNTGIELTRVSEPTGYYQSAYGKGNVGLIQPSIWLAEYSESVFNDAGPFRSVEVLQGTSNISEMLLAIACTALPGKNGPMQLVVDSNGKITGVSKDTGTGFLFLQQVQIKEASAATAIACAGSIYDGVTDELCPLSDNSSDATIEPKLVCLPRKVYKGRVIITNQGATPLDVEVVVQIPHGSIPARNGFRFQVIQKTIEQFSTDTVQYHFYFPGPRETQQANVSITQGDKIIAYKVMNQIKVVPEKPLTKWEKVCTSGDPREIYDYLATGPVYGEDFSLLCHRFVDKSVDFMQVTNILRDRGIYDPSIWAYSLINADGSSDTLRENKIENALGEYLSMNKAVQNAVAPRFNCNLFTLDQDLTLDWTFKNFQPLIHRRFFKGEFEDPDFQAQYGFFLTRVAFDSTTKDDISTLDRLTGVAYMLQQNRIVEAMDHFNSINAEDASGITELAYDFIGAYLSVCAADPGLMAVDVNAVLDKYADVSLLPSQRKFLDQIIDQLAEADNVTLGDAIFLKAELAEQAKLRLDFVKQKGPMINITYANIDKVTINFYKVDPEIQFSMIFAKDDEMYKFVRPNRIAELKLDASGKQEFKIPRQLVNQNFLCEMIHVESGLRVAKKCFDNDLVVQTASRLGEVRVLDEDTLKPLELVYVKVYGRLKSDGTGVFFKDGYTDLRGRFNYKDLSYDQIEYCDRLAILCWTETMGSSVIMLDM